MTRRAAMAVATALVGAVMAFAPQQASADIAALVDTSKPAVPDATEVILDMRSVQLWPRFQTGTVGRWTYELYPDGQAEVAHRRDTHGFTATIDCHHVGACRADGSDGAHRSVRATGTTPPGIPEAQTGWAVATYLAEWILWERGDRAAPAQDDAAQPGVVLAAAPAAKSPAVAQAPAPPPAPEVARADPMTDAAPQETRAAPATAPSLVSRGETAILLPPRRPVLREDRRAGAEPVACSGGAGGRTGCQSSKAEPDHPSLPDAPRPPGPETDRTDDAEEKTGFKAFAERRNLRCTVAGTLSLRHRGDTNESYQPGKPRGSLGCGANITDKLTLRFSVIGYARGEDQKDWDSDFTYALNYRINDTVSLSYSNYSGQFDGPNGNFLDALRNGNLRTSFRLPKIALPNDKSIPCSGSFGLPNPIDASFNVSCGYAVTPKLRVGGTLYFYAPRRQGTYQPDYSYTASYRLSENVQLSYSNYSNNRWPWNRGEAPGPSFLGGSISLRYTVDF